MKMLENSGKCWMEIILDKTEVMTMSGTRKLEVELDGQ